MEIEENEENQDVFDNLDSQNLITDQMVHQNGEIN